MAKVLKAKVRLRIGGGSATPAPPVGQMLGPHGINMMEFCKQFNAQTAQRKGETVPVIVKIFTDKTFEFTIKTSPTSELLKKRINIPKGSSKPNTDKVGKIAWKDIEEVAKIKLPDLNAVTIEEAKNIIAGTARSMGIEIID